MTDDYYGESPWNYFAPKPKAMRYTCSNCGNEISFAQVEFMSRIEDDAFTLRYRCECHSIQQTVLPYREARFRVQESALKRLLAGVRPRLPYHSAEKPALAMDSDSERELRIFSWECEQLADVDEFLLFCSRPGR